MKVLFPISGVSSASKDVLPASCTSKPQISCTSVQKTNVKQGYSNEEIYEGLVNLKNNIVSLFGGKNKQTNPVNYIA
ncbi:MAG: hypothetical protein LUB59_05135, partial [Candidatus Gastranaerophilales bacterium]|nr:hypothetical protein [Candidatus Gastranaerophilales bacterium]